MATNIYALSINTNCSGQFATNVIHFQFDDGGYTTTEDAANALITAFAAAAQTAFLNCIPASTTLLSYKARRVTGVGGFEAFQSAGAGVVGNRSGNAQVSGLCPVLILFPVANGKQRGRMFLPGISITDATGGLLVSGLRAAINSAGTTMFANLTLSGGGGPTATPVLYNRTTHIGVAVQHTQVSDMLGQIRRRQRPS